MVTHGFKEGVGASFENLDELLTQFGSTTTRQ
jgi:hypothetical protein